MKHSELINWLCEITGYNNDNPWKYLDWLKSDFKPKGKQLSGYSSLIGADCNVLGGDNVQIQNFVVIGGDVQIGSNVRIGPYTLIRGPVIIGDNVTIGPHCEVTRSILLDGSKLAHKNIMPDSILGRDVWVAGKSTFCNVVLDRDYIKIWWDHQFQHNEGKYGVVVGNNAKIGVDVTMMPGTHIHDDAVCYGPSVYFGDCQKK